MNRNEEVLTTCEKVLSGLEDGSLSIGSALMLCRKIARLCNDEDALEWFRLESEGYKYNDDGKLSVQSWNAIVQHNRVYVDTDKSGKKKNIIFIETAPELETLLESSEKTLGNLSTKGCSISGERAVLAINNLTTRVTQYTTAMLKNMKIFRKKLSILQSEYYDYALKWSIEIKFGKSSENIFESYKSLVDRYFSSLPSDIILKLKSIEEFDEGDNPEKNSQIISSCRRLWASFSSFIFEEIFPNYPNKTFLTHSGNPIDISGEHYNNKISAAIEVMENKSHRNTLIGSETLYLIDWLKNVNDLQSKGVHNNVSKEEAQKCIIHTYIALGDILVLRNEYLKARTREEENA